MAKIHKLHSAQQLASQSPSSAPSMARSISGLGPEARAKWGSRMEFFLSLAGMAIGIGNVWRFPHMVYRNGGAVFLTIYTVLLILVCVPVCFFEIAIGQFSSMSAINVWRACPIGKGIGIGTTMVSLYTCVYFNVVLCYSVYFFFACFAETLPWSNCENHWNNEWCYVRIKEEDAEERGNRTALCALHKANKSLGPCPWQTASEQYWLRRVLGEDKSPGLHHIGNLQWELVATLLSCWFIVWLIIVRGIKSSGKVVYVTALSPYIMLIILLTRGLFLQGSWTGLKYLVIPDWKKFGDTAVWRGAAEQMFYSTSTGWGVLTMLSSYNEFTSKCHVDAIIVVWLDYATSLMASVTIFSVLGYVAVEMEVDVDDVIQVGSGLAFVAYPEALTVLPIPQLWGVLFFIMLFLLGIDSEFAQLEAAIANILDSVKWIRPHTFLFPLFVCIASFLAGLPCVTQGGAYVFAVMDHYSAATNCLFLAFLELIFFMWIYGVKRVAADFQFMLGRKFGWFYIASWSVISPIVLGFICIFGWINFEPVAYRNHKFTPWANVVGLLLSYSTVAPVVIVAVYEMIKYYRKGDIKASWRAEPGWGPADPDTHRRWVMETRLGTLVDTQDDLLDT